MIAQTQATRTPLANTNPHKAVFWREWGLLTVAGTLAALAVLPGEIAAASIDIELEQGSGTACTPDATYLVHAYITADGPTTAYYELVSSTSNGFASWYVDSDNGALYTIAEGIFEFKPAMFTEGHTKTIIVPFRFVGPYPDPDNISVSVRVNSGTTYSAKLYCES